MADVIRKDVVQIGFDIEDSPLQEIIKELKKLKETIESAIKTDAFDDMKESADDIKDSISDVTEEMDDLKKGADQTKSSFDTINNIAKKTKSSFKDFASTSLTKLKTGLQEIKTKVTEIAKKAGGAALNGLKKLASVSFKALVAGIAGVTIAIGGLVAKSVSAYADLEQLQGGIETLFGAKGAKDVQEYAKLEKKTVGEVSEEYNKLKQVEAYVFKNANNAYKETGLSANEYMENVTSFSASLIASCGGDTKEAAEIAHMAMVDMSDNANKMGSDMGSIIGTYQSIAKGNFQMLDNLKLGYGGTKTELERLIKEAAEWDKSVDANSTSYANIVKAIHAVQEHMSITGTTQNEAATTITGSLGMVKAAWKNLLPAFIVGGDSLDQCMANMIDSVDIFADNVMPAVEKALYGIGTMIEKVAPKLAERLPEMAEQFIPPLIKAAVSVVKGLIKALPSIIGMISKELPNIVRELTQTVSETFGKSYPMIEKFGNFIKENAQKVTKLIPAILGLVAAFKAFKGISALSSLFGKKGGGDEGKGGGIFSKLTANFKTLSQTSPKTILKGMFNLALILGGFALIGAALMAVAPYMTQLGDIQSILTLVAVIGVLGFVGSKISKEIAPIGKLPVTTILKGIGNIAIVLAGMSVLFLIIGAISLINFDVVRVLEITLVIGAIGLIGGALAKLGGIIGAIPVSTVALGLANMSIMLGGLSVIYMLLGAISLIKFDLGRILKVSLMIGVIGIIGTALTVLGGTVGAIPVATVALGLANISIILGGMSALFLVIGALTFLDFDLKEMLKIVAIIGVLGTVGSVMAIFAGIVGMIPVPIVLAGLANIALILGGLTALIVAYGALGKIEGFNEFISTGGEVLANLFNVLGKIVGSIIGGIGEGIMSSLPNIGKSISEFAQSLEPFFEITKTVDMASIGAFFKAMGGFLLQMAGEKILSLFTGGTNLSTFGSELGDFATNAEPFFTKVATFPENGFTNATKLFDCLSGMKSLPKEGGMVSWFTGNIDYTSIATGLGQLSGENVSKFFSTMSELPQSGFDNAGSLFDCLAGMKSLPKEGGVVGWFSGNINYENIAKGLGSLGSSGVKKFFEMVSGFSKQTFENTKLLFETLAGMGDLPKEGGFWQNLGDAITGTETKSKLSVIAEDLSNFASKTGEFFKAVNSLNLGNLNGLWESLKNADTVTADISKLIDDRINQLVDKIGELPVLMGDALLASGQHLADAMATVWKNAAKASAAPVNKIISGANWILEQFGSSKRVASWTPYAKGTDGHKGGNALVNDGRGAELVQMPNGNSFIPQGRNVFLPNAPVGMKVFTAEQTAQIMGKNSPTFHYANGVGNFDVWDYADNPAGLISAMKNRFVSYENTSGLGYHIGKAMVNTISGQMTNWAQKLFEEFIGKGWHWPTTYRYISSGFGQRISPITKASSFHAGIDIPAPMGTPVYASKGGRVSVAGWGTGYGNYVQIDHGQGWQTRYGHNSSLLVSAGQRVKQGQTIALVGSTGWSTGPHIHFELRKGGAAVNPLSFLGQGYENGGLVTKPGWIGENYRKEMVIPLSSDKRRRGIDLWEKTGSMLGLSHYSPEQDSQHYSSQSAEYNTYSPQFNLTISGTNDDRETARKIKRWISEALDDRFESMASRNRRVREV